MTLKDLILNNPSDSVWISQGYCRMSIDDFYDGEVTYNVHPKHLKEINNLKAGDLVETPSSEIGLILERVDIDRQGFLVFKVIPTRSIGYLKSTFVTF